MPAISTEAWFAALGLALSAGAVAMVALACARAVCRLLGGEGVDGVRLGLTTGLVAALMPLTMAAVVGTLMLATWRGLAVAGAIFGLRVLMKASLDRELARLEERRP